jgi:threonine/homoserine/homoserine lactone efflux protein
MDLSAVAAFWLVAFLLILAPGADWAFTLSAALRGNAVLAAVGGLVTGYATMTAVVAAGVGTMVAGSAAALTGITLVGGAYLVWLGLATLHRPSTPPPTLPLPTTEAGRRTNRGTYAEGIGVSGMNPKGLLMFLALLPQFTDADAAWPIAAQMALLGVAFTLTCAAFYLTLGSFARAVLRARPVAARAMSRLSGFGMTVIGVLLISHRLLGELQLV